MKNLFRFIIITFFCWLPFVGCSQNNGSNISTTQFKELSTQNPGIILDVRTIQEFQEGHLKDAVNIDVTQPDFTERVKKLDTKKPIYVYCYVGGRSAEAVKQMQQMGFEKVYNIDGGYRVLKQQNFPTVR